MIYYHITPDFCEMNSISEGIFWGFAFQKVSFGGFLLVAKYFLGRSEIPNSADPCLKSTPWGVIIILLQGGCTFAENVCLRGLLSYHYFPSIQLHFQTWFQGSEKGFEWFHQLLLLCYHLQSSEPSNRKRSFTEIFNRINSS